MIILQELLMNYKTVVWFWLFHIIYILSYPSIDVYYLRFVKALSLYMISVLITLEIIDKGRKNYRIMSDWEGEFI